MSECPSSIKRKVEGDWNCLHCNNLNYSFRNVCNRCDSTRTVFESEFPGFESALFFTLPQIDDEEENDAQCENLPSISPFYNEKFMTIPTFA